jgi:hypothetical protein
MASRIHISKNTFRRKFHPIRAKFCTVRGNLQIYHISRIACCKAGIAIDPSEGTPSQKFHAGFVCSTIDKEQAHAPPVLPAKQRSDPIVASRRLTAPKTSNGKLKPRKFKLKGFIRKNPAHRASHEVISDP